jgi:hypothetical protein
MVSTRSSDRPMSHDNKPHGPARPKGSRVGARASHVRPQPLPARSREPVRWATTSWVYSPEAILTAPRGHLDLDGAGRPWPLRLLGGSAGPAALAVGPVLWRGTVEPRTCNSGARSILTGCLPRLDRDNRSMLVVAIPQTGCAILVMVGRLTPLKNVSSQPVTASSPGTSRPRSTKPWTTPSAIKSLAHTTASTSGQRLVMTLADS